jgi:hypothetical protein
LRASNFRNVALTIEMLAAEPRWDLNRAQALPGRSRGDLLGPWGDNLRTRFGSTALAQLRRRLPAPLDTLPPVLTAKDWVPVFAQLIVTEAIVDEWLGGDLRALYPLLVEDTRRGIGRVQHMLVRGLGPARALRLGPRAFKAAHERGTNTVEIDGRSARISFAGSPLFEHPTWRVLQLFATQMLLELCDRPGSAEGAQSGPDSFVAIARW